MKQVMVAIAMALALASAAAGQESPNKPNFVKSVKGPGLDVRYLDFRWDEEAWNSLVNGGSHPAAQRSWVLARLLLQTDPLWWNGKVVPVGPALLILNPRRGTTPATLEIRYIDMREVFVDHNVVAQPPEGPSWPTYGKAPAVFTEVGHTLPRLAMGLQDKGKAFDLSVQYGNRRTVVTLTRTP